MAASPYSAKYCCWISDAISFPDDSDSGSSGTNPRNPSSHNATDGDHSVVASTLNSSTSTFTSKQIELFLIRFEERFNIYNDKDYVAWLELNHAEAASSNLTCIDTATSSLDSFSEVSHATPVLLSDQSVFESESYAVSLSGGVDSSPTSGSHVLPASTTITVSPAIQEHIRTGS